MFIGQQIEIVPGYNSETGERDIWDDIAGCAAEIVRILPGNEYLVDVQAKGEYFINGGRIKPERFM